MTFYDTIAANPALNRSLYGVAQAQAANPPSGYTAVPGGRVMTFGGVPGTTVPAPTSPELVWKPSTPFVPGPPAPPKPAVTSTPGHGDGSDGSPTNAADNPNGTLGDMGTAAMNALGVIGFGPFSALGIGYGIANNSKSLSTMSALKGIANSLGFGDDTGGSLGFGPGPGVGNPGPDGAPGGSDGSAGPSGSSPGSSSGGAMGAESGSTGTSNDSGGSAPGGEMRDGGLVRGVGDGDDDANMRWLSNGEFVMPAGVTANMLPVLEYMRQTGKLPDAQRAKNPK